MDLYFFFISEIIIVSAKYSFKCQDFGILLKLRAKSFYSPAVTLIQANKANDEAKSYVIDNLNTSLQSSNPNYPLLLNK